MHYMVRYFIQPEFDRIAAMVNPFLAQSVSLWEILNSADNNNFATMTPILLLTNLVWIRVQVGQNKLVAQFQLTVVIVDKVYEWLTFDGFKTHTGRVDVVVRNVY